MFIEVEIQIMKLVFVLKIQIKLTSLVVRVFLGFPFFTKINIDERGSILRIYSSGVKTTLKARKAPMETTTTVVSSL